MASCVAKSLFSGFIGEPSMPCRTSSTPIPIHISTRDVAATGSTESSVSSVSSTEQEEHAHVQVDFMLSQLTDEELEIAARASYQYLVNPRNKCPKTYARTMAERYFRSKKDPHLALRKMRATLAFRKDIDIDGLRLAFNTSLSDPINDGPMSMPMPPLPKSMSWLSESSDSSESSSSSSASSAASDVAEPLERFLSTGKNVVMCYDRQGRSTHFFVPGKTVVEHPVWTLKESLYTMERALACSRAPDSSVNVIVDVRGFSLLTQTPSIRLGGHFLNTFRQHYAGQLHKIFVIDAPVSQVLQQHAPFSLEIIFLTLLCYAFCFLPLYTQQTGFSTIWKVFSPFLGKATQKKVIFLSGKKQKQSILSQYYDPSQAADWMLPLSENENGKNREFDVEEYLYKTPFDCAFDE